MTFRITQPVIAKEALNSLRGINHSHRIKFTSVRFWIVVVVNLATNSNTTSGCKNVHGSSKVDSTNVFIVHVDTVGSDCFQSCYQIFFAIQGLIVNSVIEAKLFLDQLCFFGAATWSNNLTIKKCFSELTNKTSDCTGCSTDENCFTFLWAQSTDKTTVHCCTRHSKNANSIGYLALFNVVSQLPYYWVRKFFSRKDLECAKRQIWTK